MLRTRIVAATGAAVSTLPDPERFLLQPVALHDYEAARRQLTVGAAPGAHTEPPQATCRALRPTPMKESIMLHYAVVFFVIALIAALFGFTGLAAGAANIAQILFVVFLVLAIAGFIVSMFRKSR